MLKKSSPVKSGPAFLTKQTKHTLSFSGNTNIIFSPKLSPVTPINLDLLPQQDITTKKSLVRFLKKINKSDDRLTSCYRNLYKKIYVNILITNKTHSTNSVFNLTNINFLRRERLYTKLKYSRSPAYDIVSGGAAALLAGFLGFLVSEKYGFELVDSGDFYYLFMYVVFLSFSLRPLLTAINFEKSLWTLFSPKFFLDFYLTLVYLCLRRFK
jgi:hypothetical protein